MTSPQQRTNNLKHIFSYNLPMSSLLRISIVRDDDSKQGRNCHFCMITIFPGVQKGSERTFDSQNRMTMKVLPERILGLSHCIRMHARNAPDTHKSFTIFSDPSKSKFGSSDDGNKSIGVGSNVITDKNNRKYFQITLFINQKNNRYSIPLDCSSALALADILEFCGNKCLELEYERQRTEGSGISISMQSYDNAPIMDSFNSALSAALDKHSAPDSNNNQSSMMFYDDTPF